VIKERKSKLAPQIKDLRAVRQKFQELESDYEEKKKQYDAAAVGFDSKISKLDTDVNSMRTESNEDEAKYHWINAMGLMTDVSIKRVTAGLDSQALRDRYSKKVRRQFDQPYLFQCFENITNILYYLR
jgi:predicted  nucleic acid-binding Zn-ribbon protein